MAKAMPQALLLSCEHGGNHLPAAYRRFFPRDRKVLETHRGYDLGALKLAQAISRELDAPLFAATTTRLLVDLNRSLDNRQLFSQYSEVLDEEARQRVLEKYYHPHRSRVEAAVAEQIRLGRAVLHLAVHSFTPVLDGQVRQADIGLLYDPQRSREESFCDRWHAALAARCPELRIRRNYPYRGTADGLTTALRNRLSPRRYAGVELELNQSWPCEGGPSWARLRRELIAALGEAWGS